MLLHYTAKSTLMLDMGKNSVVYLQMQHFTIFCMF